MKKKLIAFALAGMMVLSLVGCGQKDNPAGSVDDPNGGVTDNNGDNAANGDGTTNGDANGKAKSVVPGNEKGRTWDTDVRSGNSDFDNNYGSTFGGIDQDNTVYDGMGGYRTDRTATWQQMLENGRVHDRDGFLLDGENTTW